MRLLFGVLALPAVAWATPTLEHQGRLNDSSGDPLEGQHDLQFQLFDQASGGVAVHDETLSPTLENGYYHVTLGAGATPLDLADFDSTLWLEITVDPPGLSMGRQRLGDAPHAVRADILGPVRAVTTSSAITADDATIYADASTGSLTLTLPSAATMPGKIFTIARSDDTLTGPGSANVVTIATTAPDTFSGPGATQSTGLFAEGEHIVVQSTGSDWLYLSGGPSRSFSFYLPFAGGCPSGVSTWPDNSFLTCTNPSNGELTVTLRTGYCHNAPTCTATSRQSFVISGNGMVNISGYFTSPTASQWHQTITNGASTTGYGGVHGNAVCTCLR